VYPHAFEAPLERHGVGRTRKVWYNVLFLPAATAAQLPLATHPRLRVEGEIADVPVANAFIPAGDGRHYVIVSPEVIAAAALRPGQRVEMRFRIADQDAVAVPADLARALARDSAAHAAWGALTVGRRRALSHFVDGAKQAATRGRRIAAVLAAVTGGAAEGPAAADVARLARILGRPR
jgi:hypothetical protein